MEIQLLRARCPLVSVARIADAALYFGLTVYIWRDVVRLQVDEFPCFLRCVWRAYSVMSRTCEGGFLREPLSVLVWMNGVSYNVAVWWDGESEGIRYGVEEVES